MSNELVASIEHWEELATSELRMADWNDAHIGSGSAQRNKASMYKRTAQALRLENETGDPHCCCCLKPMGRHVDYWKR